MEYAAGEARFVLAYRLDPHLAAVGLNDALRDRQPQPWAAAFELRLPGRVQLDGADAVKLLEDQFLIGLVDADTGVGDHDLHEISRVTTRLPRQRPSRDRNRPSVGCVL